MKKFRFTYRSCNKDLTVVIEAESLNKAMVDFATKYHDIEKVYEIAEE